jgi:hypothetical protein
MLETITVAWCDIFKTLRQTRVAAVLENITIDVLFNSYEMTNVPIILKH